LRSSASLRSLRTSLIEKPERAGTADEAQALDLICSVEAVAPGLRTGAGKSRIRS
jgi:hypothetical protein